MHNWVKESKELRKAITGIMLTSLFFMFMLTLGFNIQTIKAEPTTIIVPDDYPTIQGAVNAANSGDTVYVRAGTYYEHVTIDKSISLIGEDKYNTIIDGNNDGIVVTVTAHNVKITGFTAQNSGSYSGIYVGSSGNNISCNIITDNRDGIYLYSSFNNTISGNNIVANFDNGIRFYISSNNSIYENNITNNEQDGMSLLGTADNLCRNNIISRNNIMANNDGSIRVRHSSNNVISENNITDIGWVGIVLAYSSENNISGNNVRGINNNYCGIQLYYSSYDIISGNNITNNGHGIHLYFSSYNIISGNNITTNNQHGINLDNWSLHNIISGNNITTNGHGINFYISSNNSIYHNNFVDNSEQVRSDSSTNIWDNSYPSGGNYWSDYTDVDSFSGPSQNESGSDGIWDHPYIINVDNEDRYPLVEPNGVLHDIAVTGIGFHHSTVYGNITVTTTYNGENVNFDLHRCLDLQ